MIDTIIVSGGNIHSDFALDFLKKNEACLIAADKGLEFFLEHQLLPDAVIGDFYEKNGLLYTKSGLNFHFQPTYLSDICFFTVLLLNLWENFPHLALPVHPSPAGFPVPVSFQKSQETSVFLSLTHPEIFFSSAGV